MLMRRQFVLTLILMPITFGIWYAAGPLFSAPAVWLYDMFTGLAIRQYCTLQDSRASIWWLSHNLASQREASSPCRPQATRSS